MNADEAASGFLAQAIRAILTFSLIVGIRCSGVVSGEREKLTWEALLLTPMETRSLVRGKLKGIMYAALPYLGAYAVPALMMSFLGGFGEFFWTVLGLLVTLLAMFYVGAAGLWCSATSRTSWRSLLWTLGFGYVGGFVLFILASPFALILAAFLYIFLQIVAEMHGTSFFRSVGFSQFFLGFSIGMSICVALLFFFAARMLQGWAEKWVADRERIRHWKHEPLGFRRSTAPLAQAEPRRPGGARRDGDASVANNSTEPGGPAGMNPAAHLEFVDTGAQEWTATSAGSPTATAALTAVSAIVAAWSPPTRSRWPRRLARWFPACQA